MKLRKVVKKFLFYSMLGVLVVNLAGCGTTSSSSASVDSITTLEKEIVLKAVATALNDKDRKQTVFITDEPTSKKTLIKDEAGAGDPNTWISIILTDLGTEQKETYNFGLQSYTKTRGIYQNEVSEEIATFNTWTYQIDTNNSDIYSQNEYDLYTSYGHSLQNTVLDNQQNLTVTLSKVDATIRYDSGIEFVTTSGSASVAYQGANYTMSVNFPFILKFDTDSNGVKENYSGTFVVTNLDSTSTTDYLSATIADENGVIYGEVQVYNDGRAKVIASE